MKPKMHIVSVDNQKIEISEAASSLIGFVNDVNEVLEEGEDLKIPFQLATEKVLKKCVEFCEYYIHNNDRPQFDYPLKRGKTFDDYVSDWYKTFYKMSEKEIVQMMNVANFLNIQPLLQITGAKLAHLCKLKGTPEIRELFGVESDFTPEEEEAIQKENEYLQKIHE